MSSSDRVWKLHKNSHGDIIFEFNPQSITITTIIKWFLSLVLKVVLPIFSFFDFLATKKKLVISSVGLGIGLGLSVLVTQQPDMLQAFPTVGQVSSQPIYAQHVLIQSIDLSTLVISGNVQDLLENATLNSLIHDARSSELGGAHPVVIAEVGLQDILKNLEQVRIGDTVTVHGSNNADYHFTVTELRDMKAEYLPHVVGAQSTGLILYRPKNVLRTQLFMVIAKPL